MPLCSIVGIVMCISFARILESNDIKILEPFIGANYMIFLLSWYFNIFSQQVLHSFMVVFHYYIFRFRCIYAVAYIPLYEKASCR